jgi:hypothetical protein
MVLWLFVFSPICYAQRGSDSSVGYIDPAIPMDVFRLRNDDAFGVNRPDRAEFFWPNRNGPPHPETNVNYSDISSYLETKLIDRVSVFADIPYRFLDPEQNKNHDSIGDIISGFKGALIYTPEQVLTFQLKTFVPTGNPHWGTGTGHISAEPCLLFYQQLTDRLRMEAQLTDWIPVSSSQFAGNVITYGTGLSYQIAEGEYWRVRPVAEIVGWSALGGKETIFDGTPTGQVVPAAGDTIVNAKFGVRVGFGSTRNSNANTGNGPQQAYGPNSDLYLGFGQALTSDVWYNQIVRVEFRIFF